MQILARPASSNGARGNGLRLLGARLAKYIGGEAKTLKLGSLFDGIGGFPLVATWYGIEPVWASEIEAAPISITKRHFPNMKHLGDVTRIYGGEIEPVDIITFGSPCQDLSVAGKRAGFGGERSALFMEAIRIINEMREATNGRYPTWAIWENVPGAFSSNKGLDFQAVLEAFCETEIPMPASGRWSSAGMVRGGRCDVAWRVLDAQFWGVPQRRKRIFLVADFGGQRTAEVLFKPESMSRHFAPGREAREEVAAAAGEGAVFPSVARTLAARHDSSPRIDRGQNFVFDCRGNGICVAPFDTTQITSRHCRSNVEYGAPCHTLSAQAHAPTICMASGQANAEIMVDKCTTLTRLHEQPIVSQRRKKVRRLTPRECERLQGFPDDWTRWGHDGKEISDSARYKAIGNSLALPCVEYVIAGIVEVEA